MFATSGHVDQTLRKYDRAYVDLTNDFVVGSCGQTVLHESDTNCYVYRENGREDFQIIYISKGTYIFLINGKEVPVNEGNIFVYYPNETQKYYSPGGIDVEVFWTHFTGSACEDILKKYGFSDGGVYYVGSSDKFGMLYKWIIKELQLKRDGYLEISNGYFKQILALMSRNYLAGISNNTETHLVERAILYFYRNFSEDISIDEYAQSLNITPCWFRRCFKKRTGVSPQQFINNIRLSYARELLITSDLKISEIANTVGYENSYYFSRIFSKNTGCSPMQFKKNNLENQ